MREGFDGRKAGNGETERDGAPEKVSTWGMRTDKKGDVVSLRASVSMVMVQKGSRGLTGTRPSLPASGQRGDPGGKVDDYKDFL